MLLVLGEIITRLGEYLVELGRLLSERWHFLQTEEQGRETTMVPGRHHVHSEESKDEGLCKGDTEIELQGNKQFS